MEPGLYEKPHHVMLGSQGSPISGEMPSSMLAGPDGLPLMMPPLPAPYDAHAWAALAAANAMPLAPFGLPPFGAGRGPQAQLPAGMRGDDEDHEDEQQPYMAPGVAAWGGSQAFTPFDTRKVSQVSPTQPGAPVSNSSWMKNRNSAAWALWQQAWAAMAASQMPYPDTTSSWPDSTPSWAAWGDVPAWPLWQGCTQGSRIPPNNNNNVPLSTRSTQEPKTVATASPDTSTAPSVHAAAVAAAALAAQQHQAMAAATVVSAGDINRVPPYSEDQSSAIDSKHNEGAVDAPQCRDPKLGDEVSRIREEPRESLEFVHDIESAVQNFLAGNCDDGWSDVSSDEGVEEAVATNEVDKSLPDSHIQNVREFSSTNSDSTTSGSTHSGRTLDGTSFDSTGMGIDEKDKHAATEQPLRCAESVPGRASNKPSPEGLQDFLKVLRCRPLPADITEERRQHLRGVIASCVLSLYRDRLFPAQNIVCRRLRERSCAEPVVQALLPLCAREPEQYRIVPPMNGEQPVILLVDEPKWFEGWVDVESADSYYSADVWDSFAEFVRNNNVCLPGQPYDAALELRRRSLPHLQNLALAELEHIVRLAVGRRGMLAHHCGNLRPVRFARMLSRAQERPIGSKPESEIAAQASKVKGSCWNPQTQKSTDANGNPYDITDKDDLTLVLLQLMQRFPEGVSLSLMKHHVAAHCNRNLNEAAFQVGKLADVFKLSPLSQIFPLEHLLPHRNEIIVKPPKHNAIPPHIWQQFYHLRESDRAGASSCGATSGSVPGSSTATGTSSSATATVSSGQVQRPGGPQAQAAAPAQSTWMSESQLQWAAYANTSSTSTLTGSPTGSGTRTSTMTGVPASPKLGPVGAPSARGVRGPAQPGRGTTCNSSW